MFCDKCGVENRNNAEYCSGCGLKISGVSKKPVHPESKNGADTPSSFIERFKHAVSDRYEVIRELGRGGMAIVFLAKDKRLERKVALKLLPEEFQHDENFRKRFLREARVSAKLSHPNIIQIHDVNEVDDFTYFSMSYIEGAPLSKIIKKGETITPKAISRLAIHICFALQQAHEKNVIHRDIKPENILINKKRMPIVVDFGIAKALTEAKLSQTGMLIGTPHYMSPEQIKTGIVDGRSDIYSLGCVLYEMAAGKTLFYGLDPTSLMYHQVNEMPPPLHTINNEIPEEFSGLIMKALAKNPDDRFQTAAEFGKALHDLMLAGPSATAGAEAAGEKQKVKPGAKGKGHTDISETLVADSTQRGDTVSQTGDERKKGAIGDTLTAPQAADRKKAVSSAKERKKSQKVIGVLAATLGILSVIVIAGLVGLQFLNKPDLPSQLPITGPEQNQIERKSQLKEESAQVEESGTLTKKAPGGVNTKTARPSETIPTTSIKTKDPVSSPPPNKQNIERTADLRKTEPVERPVTKPPESISVERERLAVIPDDTKTIITKRETPSTEQPVKQLTKISEPETEQDPPADLQEKEPEKVIEKPVKSIEKELLTAIPKPEAERIPPVKLPEEKVEKISETPVKTVATINWIPIPGGTFVMGDSQGDMEEQMMNRPVHRVTVSNFEMSRDEITVEQYAVFLRDTNHPEPDNWALQLKYPKRPVVFVAWNDAVAFAGWAGARLPTEAEWEYAARGKLTGMKYPWGDNEPADRANYNNEWENGKGWIKYLKESGSYPPNRFGLNDMSGNVYEWCYDWFGPYSGGLSTNPTGVTSSRYGRVVRGGGWNSGSKFIRNSVRGPLNPDENYPHTGFRIVRGRPIE